MNPLLFSAIALVRGWTRLYTTRMEPESRNTRRAEIESDLWEFHEDARRRGWSPVGIAVQMLARLGFGIADDLSWRFECERERETAAPHLRSSWITAIAIGAAVSVAALWVLFSVASLVALPPLPDSIHVERIYLQPMRPPPPPPPGARTVLEFHSFRTPPPPPPPR